MAKKLPVQQEEIAERMDVLLKVSKKLKWATTPEKGGLEHELTIKVSMDDVQREEVEDLAIGYGDFECRLSGTKKAEQLGMDIGENE